jgi:hypothetical protein
MSRIELSTGLKDILCFAAEQLTGSARRLFMAKDSSNNYLSSQVILLCAVELCSYTAARYDAIAN